MQLLSVLPSRQWGLCLLPLLPCSCRLRFYCSSPGHTDEVGLKRIWSHFSGLGDDKWLPHRSKLSASIIIVCKKCGHMQWFLFVCLIRATRQGRTGCFQFSSHMDLRDPILDKHCWIPCKFIMKEKSHYKTMLICIFWCSWHSAIPVGTGPEAAAMFGMKEGAVQSLFNSRGQTYYFKQSSAKPLSSSLFFQVTWPCCCRE